MTERIIPRVLLAGTSSGCGKTTITCGILEALGRLGKTPASFKCGPDYIDPMFHAKVLGHESANLDSFFTQGNILRYLLDKNSEGCDISVIEGVMGYYDGTGADGTENSTYSVARETNSPVVLIVDGKGASVSTLAVISGFLRFREDSGIIGAIINNVSEGNYKNIRTHILSHFGGGIVPLGYIPRLPEDCVLGSRHLGLITASEIEDIKQRLGRVADIILQTVDMEALVDIAHRAPPVRFEPPVIPRMEDITLAVAYDKAFCFYYKDSLNLLRDMGATIAFFSPLADEPVPKGAHGLLIGGGYPELYTDTLVGSRITAQSVREAADSSMPIIAECGGFMYLGKSIDGNPMCGALDGESESAGKLVRFGYVTLFQNRDGLFGQAGVKLKGHEFHYYDSTHNGGDCTAQKTNGTSYPCALSGDTLYAGYPHIYLYSNIDAAACFYKRCVEYKNRSKGQ